MNTESPMIPVNEAAMTKLKLNFSVLDFLIYVCVNLLFTQRKLAKIILSFFSV